MKETSKKLFREAIFMFSTMAEQGFTQQLSGAPAAQSLTSSNLRFPDFELI